MTDNLTYKTILARCKNDALEYVPDLPKENTIDAWESYIDTLESFRDEIYDHASQSVESWDWTIYTHYGLKILDALPLEVCQQAESSFFDIWGSEPIDSLNDPWDMASRIVYFALVNVWQECAEECVEELLDFANEQLDKVESE